MYIFSVSRCPSTMLQNCLYFTLNDELNSYDISTAKLWFYTNGAHDYRHLIHSNKTFTLYDIGIPMEQPNLNPYMDMFLDKKIISRKVVDFQRGWIHFDVERELRSWLQRPTLSHGVAINCESGCSSYGEPTIDNEDEWKPFLLIHTSPKRHRRRKRLAYQCVSGVKSQRCCMATFRIDLNQMENWDWIIRPRIFDLNYCTGSCYGKYY